MAPVQEVSGCMFPEPEMFSCLSPRPSIGTPSSSTGLGLGLDLHGTSSILAVLSIVCWLPNELRRRARGTNGRRTGMDDAMRMVLPSILQGQVRCKRAEADRGGIYTVQITKSDVSSACDVNLVSRRRKKERYGRRTREVIASERCNFCGFVDGDNAGTITAS
jgi:hypothetical protein